ncbi:hypothetical protein N1I87_14685 [Bacillus sp. FSL W8-0102]
MTLDYRSMAVLTKLVRSPSFVTVQELTESVNYPPLTTLAGRLKWGLLG